MTAQGLVLEMPARPLPGMYDPSGPGRLFSAFYRAAFCRAPEHPYDPARVAPRVTAASAALFEYEFRTPTGKRVYNLRHTCLMTWLNSGVPPARIAERAGDGARCVVGRLDDHPGRAEGSRDLLVVTR
ncbi:hypothetical protein [Streptomyces sp. MS19]|uniref:hypothetical protein n=1 Tax=Streptomyces sp. MS19 TaxID=3385972 RepID=UPI00399FD8F8